LRGDLFDEGDHLKLTAEIPGVSKEELKISFLDNILTISGERKPTELPEDAYWIKDERVYGKFLRTFKIPVEIDPAKISAEYHDGLLLLTLVKSEKAKPKEIEINIK
jgi:HSP20 family protein